MDDRGNLQPDGIVDALRGLFGADGDVALNTALMAPFASDRGLLRQRINAALQAASARSEVDATRTAGVGYCFGGMCVLELARMGAPVQGVASVHGIFSAGNAANASITAKVLCLHGHDDPMVPVADVVALETELTATCADWQIHTYGKTLHSFTNPEANDPGFGVQYSARADQRSWATLLHFLAERLA